MHILLQKIPIRTIEKVGGKLLTFGLFRLGVSEKNSKIDAVLVVPRHIDRNDFDKIFFKMLQNRTEASSIKVSLNKL